MLGNILVPVKIMPGYENSNTERIVYVNLDHVVDVRIRQITDKDTPTRGVVALMLDSEDKLILDQSQGDFEYAVERAQREVLALAAEYMETAPEAPEPWYTHVGQTVGASLFGSVTGGALIFIGWLIYKSAAGL